MNDYKRIGKEILENGQWTEKRNGRRLSLFGEVFRHNMSNGFPMVTTRYVPYHLVVSELVWFLRGRTDLEFLHKYNNKVWDANSINGEVGPIYGVQWNRKQQLKNVLRNIKSNPYSTRHLINTWNIDQLEEMCLPPCHFAFQFHCTPDNGLTLQVFQRSADFALGVSWNIPSYASLLCLAGRLVEREPKELIFSFGDVHLYEEHIEDFKKQMEREQLDLPVLELNSKLSGDVDWLDEVEVSDFELRNYKYHERIKYRMMP